VRHEDRERVVAGHLAETEGVGDRPGHPGRVADRREVDERGRTAGRSGGLDGEAGLAGPARPGQRHEPRRLVPEQRLQLCQLAFAADERRGRRRQRGLAPGFRRGRLRAGLERGVLPEDGALELLQRRRRLDTELVDQHLARLAVEREGLRLPRRPVEGQHQLGPQALAQRVLRHQQLELRHQLEVASERQVGLDPGLERRQAKLLEPRDVELRERVERELGQRRAAPQRQRPAQRLARPPGLAGGQRLASLLGEPVEHLGVERAGRQGQDVPRRDRGDGVVPERLSELRDVALQHGGHRRRRVRSPEGVDQPVARDRRVPLQQEQRQERTLATPPDDERLLTHAGLERAQDAELHQPSDSGGRQYRLAAG
jgi:hypothetical protein